MDRYTSDKYHADNDTWHVEDSPWKAKQIIRLLEKNQVQFNTVCEVGCGAGEILVQLNKELSYPNLSFHGYDIAPDVEPFWAERISNNIDFSLGDFTQTNELYDLLLMIDIIEHIEDYIGFLRQVRDRATYHVFNFPLEIFALKAMFGKKFVSSRRKYGHLHYFNKELCIELLEELDYEVVDFFYAPGALETIKSTTSMSKQSRWLDFPRRLFHSVSIDLTAKTLGGYSLFILTKTPST